MNTYRFANRLIEFVGVKGRRNWMVARLVEKWPGIMRLKADYKP